MPLKLSGPTRTVPTRLADINAEYVSCPLAGGGTLISEPIKVNACGPIISKSKLEVDEKTTRSVGCVPRTIVTVMLVSKGSRGSWAVMIPLSCTLIGLVASVVIRPI